MKVESSFYCACEKNCNFIQHFLDQKLNDKLNYLVINLYWPVIVNDDVIKELKVWVWFQLRCLMSMIK
jgi:hypothetical protein